MFAGKDKDTYKRRPRWDIPESKKREMGFYMGQEGKHELRVGEMDFYMDKNALYVGDLGRKCNLELVPVNEDEE